MRTTYYVSIACHLVIGIGVSTVNGLKCYECASQSNADCKDHVEKVDPVECPAHYDHCYTVRNENLGEDGSVEEIYLSRGCCNIGDPVCPKDDDTVIKPTYKQHFCNCDNGDLCNNGECKIPTSTLAPTTSHELPTTGSSEESTTSADDSDGLWCWTCGSTDSTPDSRVPECEKDPAKLGPDSQVKCKPEYDHCYTRRDEKHDKDSTVIKGLDVSRGCCEVKADSTVCPTGKTMDHYDDRDRYYCYCKGPLCNTVECKADDNPTTPSGNNGGNGHHNGVIVPGKSGANPFIKANVICLVISLAINNIMS